MRKGLVFILVLLMALLFTACGGDNSTTSDTPNDPIEFETGEYDGNLDENGKRSGQGAWICDNFRYEGNWENDSICYSSTMGQWLCRRGYRRSSLLRCHLYPVCYLFFFRKRLKNPPLFCFVGVEGWFAEPPIVGLNPLASESC